MGRLREAFVPPQFRHPIGLAGRLFGSRSPEALHAMAAAVVGAVLTPLDVALARAERRQLETAPEPDLPILLVMGPPRSGTTLLALSLIRSLPVSYFNNLTAIFPRAPIRANELLPGHFDRKRVTLRSFYGRTRLLCGPNDALHIWDRWLGGDRTRAPSALSADAVRELPRFFGAWLRAFGGPLVAKNNSLNGCAQLVAPLLPTARFVLLRREPLWLGASLLEARRMIHGDLHTSYGIDDPGRPTDLDPIDDIVRQLRFHDTLAARQRAALGPRLRELAYEDFCVDPVAQIASIAREELRLRVDVDALRSVLAPLAPSQRSNLPAPLLARLERAVADAFPGRA